MSSNILTLVTMQKSIEQYKEQKYNENNKDYPKLGRKLVR